ncbi:MAG: hypothetical protein M1824_005609 [Vezdaea acicularis]|nr:MAG: hypothetical protein M1824_005609 [Vezdaea acicularis]
MIPRLLSRQTYDLCFSLCSLLLLPLFAWPTVAGGVGVNGYPRDYSGGNGGNGGSSNGGSGLGSYAEFRIKCEGNLPDGWYGSAWIDHGNPVWSKNRFQNLEDLCSAFGNTDGNLGGLCWPTLGTPVNSLAREPRFQLELAVAVGLSDDRILRYCKMHCFCTYLTDLSLASSLSIAAARYGLKPGVPVPLPQSDYPSLGDTDWGGPATYENTVHWGSIDSESSDDESESSTVAALAQSLALQQTGIQGSGPAARRHRRRPPVTCAPGSAACGKVQAGPLPRNTFDPKRARQCAQKQGQKPGVRRPSVLPMSCAMEAMSAFGSFRGPLRRR